MVFLVHQPQVFNAVVRTVMVYMVNHFAFGQIPTDCPFHQYGVKHHITVSVCVWVLWRICKDISPAMLLCVSVSVQAVIIA